MTTSPLNLSRRSLLIGASAFMVANRSVLAAQTRGARETIDFPARLGTMLGAVPARDVTAGEGIPFYYADLSGQLASVGVERPQPDEPLIGFPEGFVEATYSLPLASRAFQSGLVREWFDTFGFSPLAIGQMLEITVPGSPVSVLAGGFERDRVEAALQAAGYTRVDQETGGSYWAFGDDWDPSTAVGRLGVGAMNQAIVDDELLIFTREESLVQEVTQVRAGLAPSMLDQGLWSGMLPIFSPDVVGLVPVAPALLAREPMSLSAATPAATPVDEEGGLPMEYIAFGVRAGARSVDISLVGEGTPEATAAASDSAIPAQVEVRIRYGDTELVEQEAIAISERWESAESMLTGQPFTDLMTFEEARVSSVNPHVLELDFTASTPNIWVRMIHTVDLLPLLPAEG